MFFQKNKINYLQNRSVNMTLIDHKSKGVKIFFRMSKDYILIFK